ncbi:hypothetical protein FOA52_012837 [Chlamydomonas sp. UWO 241]|nr:hypothetical protein FOA52_012837 [Chlamydomonas sp. UWO 241]
MASAATSSNAPALREPAAVEWPAHQPLAGCEAGSFAEGTITVRLPAIVAGTLKDMEAVAAASSDAAYAAQLRAAATAIDAMRSELLTASASCPADLVAPAWCSPALSVSVAATNCHMAAWRVRLGPADAPTWLALPWLLVECYMYARIQVAIQAQPLLAAAKFDPFHVQKIAAFDKSRPSIASLGAAVSDLLEQGTQGGEEGVRDRLYQVMQYALWGNKTDLSLLVDASKIDPTALAAPSSDGGKASPYLIVDEFDAVWELLRKTSGRSRRVDIVLDNSGLELYSDLCLGDALLACGLADEVVFHGKPFAWFVSDTTEKDFAETLNLCAAPDPFGSEAWAPVQSLAARWKGHVAAGRWRYTEHPFWVTPAPFTWMAGLSPDLHGDLQAHSALAIFKGDLNYRKLTFDCRWPWTTPFSRALQGFGPCPILSLRTLKADVVVGLKPGEGEALAQVDAGWQVNGKFGMVQGVV